MISALKGIVRKREPGKIFLQTGENYFFEINTPASYYFDISDDEEVLLYTVVRIKDEEIRLYGFLNSDQKNFFLKMISVSGIGAKTALLMISSFSPEEFLEVLEGSDVEKLSSIPGIGKKTAQRVILELSGKLSVGSLAEGGDSGIKNELISALINLGFSSQKARHNVSEILKEKRGEVSFEKLFRLVLKKASNIETGESK